MSKTYTFDVSYDDSYEIIIWALRDLFLLNVMKFISFI